ncbi:MAG: hypothetical protein CV087_10630 [Candidatus Brocadia sp. WS118]|nr:MAG: hypothetical protein CV087_10630 [Candidatus Brocadia sp. WS118]
MAFLGKRKNARNETVWVIHYRVGKNQKMITIGKTDKRTAQKVFTQFTADLARNRFGLNEIKRMTLKDYIKEYLEYAVVEKASSTLSREERILHKLQDFTGDIFLTDITIKLLEGYRLQRQKLVNEVTINLEFRHLKAIFNRAKKLGYLSENPFSEIKPIRVPESDIPRFFEIDDIKKVREAFKDDSFHDLVEFYLLTGARLKEPLSLTWDNVDFKRMQLRIKSPHTKSKKHRIISFEEDEPLENLLRNLPKRADNLLFGPEDNKSQWRHWWVSHRISLKLSKLGFPWATCHTFRHTYISHLVMAGVPLYTVKEMVGHSSINTTLRYAHLAPKHTKEMHGKRPY